MRKWVKCTENDRVRGLRDPRNGITSLWCVLGKVLWPHWHDIWPPEGWGSEYHPWIGLKIQIQIQIQRRRNATSTIRMCRMCLKATGWLWLPLVGYELVQRVSLTPKTWYMTIGMLGEWISAFGPPKKARIRPKMGFWQWKKISSDPNWLYLVIGMKNECPCKRSEI